MMTKKQLKKYNELMTMSNKELNTLRNKHWAAREIAKDTIPNKYDRFLANDYATTTCVGNVLKLLSVVIACNAAKYVADKISEKL